tara:strand:- start:435 stop:686 length:252 start_codon:yes stop_codon:yes gene_type:complete
MKKNYLLVMLFTFIFSFSAQSQATSTNQKAVKSSELKSAKSSKQTIQKKSTVQKAVRIQMMDPKKEKATTTPKQKAKLEDSNN